MNLFEGSRRIAKIFAVVIVVCSVFGIYVSTPSVYLRYKVLPYGEVILDADDDCRIGIDGLERDEFTTKGGTKFNRVFCFVAMKADNGALLVPYKTEGQSFLLNQPYSDEVKAHMADYISRNAPKPDEFDKADSEQRSLLLKHWGKGLGSITFGLLCYWILVWSVGWVFRGFMGVPRGQDYRPSAAA